MSDPNASTPHQAAGIPRRGFLTRFSAGLVGAIAGLVPFLSGLVFFFDPLLRKRAQGGEGGSVEKDDEGFVKLDVTATALPEDGTPQLFKVRDDVVDAWNKFLNVEIGSVWLRRNPGGDPSDIAAFTSVCPHLGCTVDFRPSERDFYCPCHTSAFELDGEKKNEIPPRDMDSLKLKVKDDGSIWVKYEKFRATIPEKVPIA